MFFCTFYENLCFSMKVSVFYQKVFQLRTFCALFFSELGKAFAICHLVGDIAGIAGGVGYVRICHCYA